jgi:putative transposase
VRYRVSAFQQLMKPLDRRMMKRIVDRHRGDHGVGNGSNAWGCIRHLRTLLFAQFTGLNSLREIQHGLAAQPGSLYHLDLRLPRRSTLSDAMANRPWKVFRDIGQELLGRANRTLRGEGAELIELIDSSPIYLEARRFPWAEADPHTRGLKLHVGYDPRADVATWAELETPRMSEIKVARQHPIRSSTVYVFDKGYMDYGWWQQIHEAKAVFVSRLKRNTRRRDVTPRVPVGEGIVEDNFVKIGHARPRGGAINLLFDTPLREILVAREGKAPIRLVTNDLTRPASEIAALYKERWQIELLFKWIKQNLKIKRFIGRSENAVKTQIFVALIAFLLLRLLKQSHARSEEHSAKNLIARLRVSLMRPLDLTNRATAPPRPPTALRPPPQLTLNLAAA